MRDAIVSVQNVSKSFGEERVLKNVTRDFEAGKIHGIVGNNGSGKTVLMKCVCGFLIPAEGKIFVEGKLVGVDVDFPGNLGLIIETPGFLPQLSGVKNLEILASLSKKIGLSEIAASIRRVGLDPALKKPVGKYSLGMRQRLGIAQAIMEDPKLLVLDEPLNGLDKHGAAEMRALLKRLKNEEKTILLASHNQQDIDELCDTVCDMDDGIMTMIREG
ncbi:MAG TPA: ATP-binding cassette domain-containing protein [Clostridia bacterium]|nr:ATP-binding cassette domain-containing protein [Clostridia bacterium]